MEGAGSKRQQRAAAAVQVLGGLEGDLSRASATDLERIAYDHPDEAVREMAGKIIDHVASAESPGQLPIIESTDASVPVSDRLASDPSLKEIRATVAVVALIGLAVFVTTVVLALRRPEPTPVVPAAPIAAPTTPQPVARPEQQGRTKTLSESDRSMIHDVLKAELNRTELNPDDFPDDESWNAAQDERDNRTFQQVADTWGISIVETEDIWYEYETGAR